MLSDILPAILMLNGPYTYWLCAGWPAFEASLLARMMNFSQADERKCLAAVRDKRAPKFGVVD